MAIGNLLALLLVALIAEQAPERHHLLWTDSTLLYVTEGRRTVSVLSPIKTTIQLPINVPSRPTLAKDGDTWYVAGRGSSYVSAVRGNRVTTISLEGTIWSLAKTDSGVVVATMRVSPSPTGYPREFAVTLLRTPTIRKAYRSDNFPPLGGTAWFMDGRRRLCHVEKDGAMSVVPRFDEFPALRENPVYLMCANARVIVVSNGQRNFLLHVKARTLTEMPGKITNRDIRVFGGSIWIVARSSVGDTISLVTPSGDVKQSSAWFQDGTTLIAGPDGLVCIDRAFGEERGEVVSVQESQGKLSVQRTGRRVDIDLSATSYAYVGNALLVVQQASALKRYEVRPGDRSSFLTRSLRLLCAAVPNERRCLAWSDPSSARSVSPVSSDRRQTRSLVPMGGSQIGVPRDL